MNKVIELDNNVSATVIDVIILKKCLKINHSYLQVFTDKMLQHLAKEALQYLYITTVSYEDRYMRTAAQLNKKECSDRNILCTPKVVMELEAVSPLTLARAGLIFPRVK